jgi:hypothetical protein
MVLSFATLALLAVQTVVLWMQWRITERQLDAAQAEQFEKLSHRVARTRALVAKLDGWKVPPEKASEALNCDEACRGSDLAETVMLTRDYNSAAGSRLMVIAHAYLQRRKPDPSDLSPLPKLTPAAEVLMAHAEGLVHLADAIGEAEGPTYIHGPNRKALSNVRPAIEAAALDCLPPDQEVQAILGDMKRMTDITEAVGNDGLAGAFPYDYRGESWVPETIRQHPQHLRGREALAPVAIGTYLDEMLSLRQNFVRRAAIVRDHCRRALDRDLRALRSLESMQ